MRRLSIVMLAILLTMSTVGIAGCTKRKSKAGRSKAGSAPERTDPTPTRSSASPSAGDAAGRPCSEVLDRVAAATRMAWRLDGGQTQASPESLGRSGNRKCHFQVSGTATLPPAVMSVTFYRMDPNVDSTYVQVRERAATAATCTEELASPPVGATLAVQCLNKHGGTLFDVRTTVSGMTGYVHVLVSQQPDRASTALENKAREIGAQAAGVALRMV